jgi:polysaccharide biosynthesis protein PslG
MVRHDDQAKPIWISEMGWNAAPEPLPPIYGRVTEEEQARYAVEGYERARSEWPWIGAVNYWFFKRHGDGERDQSWYYFRMMEPDFTPLPVWEALAEYAPAAGPPATYPAWFYSWLPLRPWFFLAGLALFFYTLLALLAPPEP